MEDNYAQDSYHGLQCSVKTAKGPSFSAFLKFVTVVKCQTRKKIELILFIKFIWQTFKIFNKKKPN
jgi:hypothetical protein